MKCFSVKSSVQSQVVCVRSSVSAGGRSENLVGKGGRKKGTSRDRRAKEFTMLDP